MPGVREDRKGGGMLTWKRILPDLLAAFRSWGLAGTEPCKRHSYAGGPVCVRCGARNRRWRPRATDTQVVEALDAAVGKAASEP